MEEKYWGHRARVNWLEFGDHNYKFFHAIIIQRRQRNIIIRIKGEYEVWKDNEEEISSYFKEFFVNLFSSASQRDLSNALNFVNPKVSEDDNNQLIKLVDQKEIKEAVFQLGKDKARGLMAFLAIFFSLLGR